jgi:hypothetical protein
MIMDTISTTDLLRSPLASLAAASAAVKTFISFLKVLFPKVGEPSTFAPVQIRVAAVVLGIFCALALKIGPLALPPEVGGAWAIGNQVLGGLMVAAGALGTHEVIDMAKRPS